MSRINSVPLTHFSVETCSSSLDAVEFRAARKMAAIASSAKRVAVLLVSVLSVGVGWSGLYLAGLQLSGNFHTVVAGELYRSAQPTVAMVAAYRENYGIRTIINLRGENIGSGWYDAEVAEAKKLGISHVDFPMSARRLVTPEQFDQIVDVLQKAEKPILIHCKSGSDRSGLVSAFYVAAISKLGEEAAESQISFRYGHIPLSISAPYAMDRSFEAFEPVLGFPKS